MKSVLISIHPKWCELIIAGKKTAEVRKSRPKLKTPFKVYIYCTKDFKPNVKYGFKLWAGRGKVIGEFVCDVVSDARECFIGPSCLTTEEWLKYTNGYKRQVWCWRITDVKIYDVPKALSEFRKPCDYDLGCKSCSMHFGGSAFAEPYCKNGDLEITRPPQSWCYVEELP